MTCCGLKLLDGFKFQRVKGGYLSKQPSQSWYAEQSSRYTQTCGPIEWLSPTFDTTNAFASHAFLSAMSKYESLSFCIDKAHHDVCVSSTTTIGAAFLMCFFSKCCGIILTVFQFFWKDFVREEAIKIFCWGSLVLKHWPFQRMPVHAEHIWLKWYPQFEHQRDQTKDHKVLGLKWKENT